MSDSPSARDDTPGNLPADPSSGDSSGITLPDLDSSPDEEVVSENVTALSAIYFAAQLEQPDFAQPFALGASEFLEGTETLGQEQEGAPKVQGPAMASSFPSEPANLLQEHGNLGETSSRVNETAFSDPRQVAQPMPATSSGVDDVPVPNAHLEQRGSYSLMTPLQVNRSVSVVGVGTAGITPPDPSHIAQADPGRARRLPLVVGVVVVVGAVAGIVAILTHGFSNPARDAQLSTPVATQVVTTGGPSQAAPTGVPMEAAPTSVPTVSSLPTSAQPTATLAQQMLKVDPGTSAGAYPCSDPKAYATITLANSGGQTLTWSAKASASEVSVNPTQETLGPGASAMVTVSGAPNAASSFDVVISTANETHTVTYTCGK